jgi:hypothetical protein
VNPKFDREELEEPLDFEATQEMLSRAMNEGRRLDPVTARMLWERKTTKRLKAVEDELKAIREGAHDTQEIATIAQRELKPYTPIREFWEFCVTWRRRIVRGALGAAVTGLVGALVVWWLGRHGIKATP